MPIRLIAWLDLLGFIAFLVFLIVNGIIAGREYESSVVILLAYTSVPWMFSCIIHGLIVAQFVLPYPFGNLQIHPVCPDCHREWKHDHRDGETYSLLRDEDDPESQAAGAKVTDGAATARTQRQQSDV